MKNSVGVISCYEFLNVSLKRLALMFQQVAVPNWSIAIKHVPKDKPWPEITELEWLLEKEIVFDPINISKVFFKHSDEEHCLGVELEKIYSRCRMLQDDCLMMGIDHKEAKIYLDAETEYFKVSEQRNDFEKRRISSGLRELFNFDSVPITSPQIYSTQAANVSDVMQIVLGAIPVPDSSTPWEHILEYRNDPDTQEKFLDLREWMNDVARAKLTPIEIEQKLEYLISLYKRHMTLHKMKMNTGALETVVVSGAEILEDLVRFKFSRAAKALFTVKHRKISLMEGELISPGSEVAYIVKARETLT